MAQPTSVPPPDEVEHPAECRHHWVIQPATGPVSQGNCQVCGEAREFKNYVEAATWGNSRAAGRPRSNNANNSESVAQPTPDAPEDEKGK